MAKAGQSSFVLSRVQSWEKLALYVESRQGGTFATPPEKWAVGLAKMPRPGLLEQDIAKFLQEHQEELLAYKYGTSSSKDPFKIELAIVGAYLAGIIATDEHGRDRHEYCGPNTERVGRKLLVQLLKSDVPLPRKVRMELAWLFDIEHYGPHSAEREMKIAFRRKGKRSDPIRDIQIAEAIEKALLEGEALKNAFCDVSARFKLSRSVIAEVWGRMKAHYYPARKSGSQSG